MSQLEGGIHRYLEQYPDGGLFQGKNYVFDKRIITAPNQYQPAGRAGGVSGCDVSVSHINSNSNNVTDNDGDVSSSATAIDATTVTTININSNTIAGKCLYCSSPYDTVSAERVCCVCRLEVLVCEQCVSSNSHPGEYHCASHM